MDRIEQWTDSLAELAVFGANVQPGQIVAVTSYIGKEALTRRIAHEAYARGAKYVARQRCAPCDVRRSRALPTRGAMGIP